MQLQVTSSPFSKEQVELLNQLLPSLSSHQKIWLSGYLSAVQHEFDEVAATATLEQNGLEGEVSVQTTSQVKTRDITILFGTDTGNSKRLAETFSQKLENQNFNVSFSSMEDFKPKSIKNVQDLLIVTSTHGDGDPPDNALSFHEFLHGKKAPKLEGVRFSVLALGDTSYEFFCQAGKDFDKRLEELGGERLYPRVDCDLDYEEPAAEWFEGVLEKLKEDQAKSAEIKGIQDQEQSITYHTNYSKTNPFKAEVLENINLNGRGSNKETHHLELDLEGSNLTYEPGDSLGILPENDPAIVDAIIKNLGWNPDESLTINKQGDLLSIREALSTYFDITSLTKPLLEKAARLSENEELKKLVESNNRDDINAYIDGRDLLDLIQDFGPWKASAADFIKILRKLPARLYSIASSLKANPDEVHLTIGKVSYHAHGRDRKGVCSGQISEHVQVGDRLSVFVQKNDNFRLPENPDTPVIMIGAGTGVAPYRSFLQEREEIEAKGDSWLFFGDQHFVTDFLYQIEWQKWLKDGVLSRLDVAFSRDTDKKVYVQHRMLEKSKDLYEWLEKGAHVYVCGDEKHMAKDVHQTLLTIIEKEGNKSPEEAENYVASMRKEKRYQRDVY
ncbi:assimilatory sulfite reductase (NADPH) flavoprotein subunit [Terrilactibacillus sp. BCM23-1]|uniref:assimilatory sulfite reductase (NADPH) n=1 Tax=Terrilactibacillus tamarindi TaxID=2599694 RepID=A0A6N8CP45_9BACI|nr:assimilatory sulfite reductase (NADPH) flavoprotein subunit [Terrilactibacillus tamarindi]MTT31771.1 assimilatory sulfite reductase (NADPH) flavoprotein subunit [Terrilactibacillus tamarindi]